MKTFFYERMSESFLFQHKKFLLMKKQHRDYCWDALEPELFTKL